MQKLCCVVEVAITTALSYVNTLRSRAGLNTPVKENELTLDFILDERGRELYWEGWRRQDLIRFGKFTGNSYNWQWKGDTYAGTTIPHHLKLFPLPADQLQMNKNLKQNEGY